MNAEVERLGRKGFRVVSTLPDGSIVMERTAKVGTFWNVVLSIATGGLWLIVVAIKLINRKVETKVVAP